MAADDDCYRFRLPYRPPYDWEALLAFLAARATPGVETVEGSRYRRTIALDGKTGVVDVAPVESPSALALEVRFPEPGALPLVVERVRRLFDLGADPSVIEERLAADPVLRRLSARHRGIRVPGAWDGFELAVRAVLGQQVSVRAATTLAGRIATAFGTPVASAGDGGGLERLFPTPAQLVNAPLERAGVMPARGETIRALARRVGDGALTLGPSVDSKTTIVALEQLPGIGPWTAQYIAMRALGEPDAFPCSDLGLLRATGDRTARALDRRSQAWRPWRAYAAMLLWSHAATSLGARA